MKQIDVLRGVKAMIVAALPLAEVRGFDEEDVTEEVLVGPGGSVLGFPGDPGQPEVDLSPPAYNYDHEIALEVSAASDAPVADLLAMLAAIGAAVAADRTLGGLCEYLVATAPGLRDRTTDGVTTRWAELSIVASYVTSDPLA